MDDERIWAFEDSLWRATAEHYRESIDNACLMVVPAPPFVLSGAQAVAAVSKTPRWAEAKFSESKVSRVQEGLIVIAYRMLATRPDADPYDAHCSSVYHEDADGKWTVIQHQQTPVLKASA